MDDDEPPGASFRFDHASGCISRERDFESRNKTPPAHSRVQFFARLRDKILAVFRKMLHKIRVSQFYGLPRDISFFIRAVIGAAGLLVLMPRQMYNASSPLCLSHRDISAENYPLEE